METHKAVRIPKLGEKITRVATYYHPRTWKEKGLWWTLLLFLITYWIIIGVIGTIWSRTPGKFDPREQALALSGNDPKKLVPGYVTTATIIHIAECLLDKPGGYLSNDVTPPGVYLDNIPEWEFGTLTELRDLTRALRNDFSRSQTQSIEDRDLQIAEPKFNYDSDSWILPSTESEYRDGITALYRYLNRLTGAKDSRFFTRADNLNAYLQVVEKRLGSLAQRLASSVGQTRLNFDLASGSSSHQLPAFENLSQIQFKTPWLQIDNIFFEARGYTWALLHTLKAITIDFYDVLSNKNALVSLKQIIRDMEDTQAFIWSPIILNGTGFSLVASHSLIMASYISRANAAIIDLRSLLLQG